MQALNLDLRRWCWRMSAICGENIIYNKRHFALNTRPIYTQIIAHINPAQSINQLVWIILQTLFPQFKHETLTADNCDVANITNWKKKIVRIRPQRSCQKFFGRIGFDLKAPCLSPHRALYDRRYGMKHDCVVINYVRARRATRAY